MPFKKKQRVPAIIQMQAGESGATCLLMIMAYHNSFPSREKVSALCGVNNNGVSKDKLLMAATHLGIETTVSDIPIDALGTKQFPLIMPFRDNHFVILKGIRNNTFLINDPAEGNVTMSRSDLESQYRGQVIECSLGAGFLLEKETSSFFKQIWSRLSYNLPSLIFILLVGLILILPGIILPGLSRVFFDDIVIKSQSSWFKPMLSFMAAMLVIGSVLAYLQQQQVLKTELRMSLIESAKFFEHIFKLPISFFTNRHPGEVFKRIQLNDTIATLLSRNLTTALFSLCSVILYGLVMIKYSLILTIVGVSITLINLLALRIISAKRTALNQVLFENSQKTFSTAGVGIEQMETIKASGSENDFYELWAGYLTSSVNNDQRLGISSRFLDVLPTFLSQLNTAIMVILGGLLIMKGNMTVGVFIAFQGLMTNFTDPIKNVVDMGGQLQLSKSNMDTLRDAMDTDVDLLFKEKELNINTISVTESHLSGQIEVKNLTFGYDHFAEPLISDFSLTVTPGKRIALVGGSGSGKSTVAKVIAGLYQPWTGSVSFDGRDRNTIHADVLRHSLSMVDQEIFLFMGTVADNITMWDKTMPYDDIVQAAKDAGIHDIIAARPDNYNSKVTPGGTNFSGGQRQRIEIARALVTNPTILIMDEATSALDTDTELLIDHNIRRRGCTTIIIAHRLSTIKDCDEIIVMDHGKVVQRGTHDELLAQEDKLYYQLVKHS
jgi:NHLM bacteriocin system ABC transporter peptidase/ATP-binding protein